MQLRGLNDVTSDHRHIYLSPHFDDVAYSCGGTIGIQASRGEHPLVITIFAGMPSSELKLSRLASKVHKLMEFDQRAGSLIAIRHKEDASAIAFLHADYLWLDYLDAIYRGTPAYYKRWRSIIRKVHSNDVGIVKQLAQDLGALHERLPNASWYAPLGLGYHVDHQIVFAVAHALLQQGAHVKFYEDFPYVMQTHALQKRLRELGNTLKPELVEISETLHLRREAAAMYSSQVKLNFGTKEAMYKAMKDYAFSNHPIKSVPVERYWTL